MSRRPIRQALASATALGLLTFASLSAGAAPAGAQTLLDNSVRVGPQAVSYRIGGGVDARISEVAVPVAVVVPLGARLNLDVATAWASSRVEQEGTKETITGLTDTQLRANYTFGGDFIVLTAGLNLPTGQATVKTDQLRAAGYIGNDFLALPVSNMGTGFAGTGGIAVARPLGSWNVGFGASMRHTASYDAFEIQDTAVRFQPGDEYRARLGVDRAVGPGRVAFGVTYSAFGKDKDAQSSYSTGNRIITQAAWSAPMGGVDVFLSGWDLARQKGDIVGGSTAPPENIANLGLTLGIRALGTTLEPSAEVRNWTRDGSRAGTLAQLGLRLRLPVGPLSVFPGGSFTTGSWVEQIGDTTDSASLSGWRAMLAIRYGR